MTRLLAGLATVCLLVPGAWAQTAARLQAVHTIYLGSFGAAAGGDEMRHKLEDVLKHNRRFQLVRQLPADGVLEGRAEIWIRAYHSLSPRARKNHAYAEPVYGAYLSANLKGLQAETLWSYFVTPRRASVNDVKEDLAEQLVGKLAEAADATEEERAVAEGARGTAVTLQGAGATFPFPIYQQWFTAFRVSHPAVQLTYDGVGSTEGMARLLAGKLDFAGSDIPAKEASQATGQERWLQFPSVVGAVVVIYNLPEFDGELHLSPEALAAIFGGKIKRWNDPALRALNRGRSLPDEPIQVVHRSNGSGTTFVLTDYLTKTDAAWRQEVGRGASVRWAVGVGATGNEGVSNAVQRTRHSIGYVEFIYAFRKRLSFAAIRNAAGEYIQADLASITAAANSALTASSPDAVVASISNPPGKNSYPMAAFTWLMVPAANKSAPDKTQALKQFLQWMLTAGQKQCMGLGYGPLPAKVIAHERQVIDAWK